MTDALEPAPRAVRVVAAVIVNDGRVLACRRKPDRSAGGQWEFPGGKVEPGETDAEALAREIREELGVEIVVGRLLSRETTLTDGGPIDLACYWAQLVGAAPVASTDHDALAWLGTGRLDALRWALPDRPTVGLLSSIAGVLQ